jgi:type IV pilus assembly protein PilV
MPKTGTYMKKTLKNDGFTLIETLIAIAIFAIGILAVLSMQISAVNTNATAKKVTDNYTWAAQRVEEFMALPFTDALLNDTGGNFFSPAQDVDGIDNNADGQIDEPGEDGYATIAWRVQENPPANGFRSKNITIRMTSSGRGGPKTIHLDFLKLDI